MDPVRDAVAAPVTKILFVIGTLEVGGTETQLVELATRLDRRFFEPVVCCLAPEGPLGSRLRARGIAVHPLGFSGFQSSRLSNAGRVADASRLLIRMWKLIRRERPAILHGMLFWAYVLGTFVGRAAGVPIVVSSRRSLGLFKADKPRYLFMERIADRMTDLFIANSEAVRTDTLAREPVKPSNIIVIHNGLDLGRFDAAPDAALAARLGVAGRRCAIVVSNFIDYKGHAYLLRAWRELLRRFPSAVVMLVGDGVLRREMERLADELQIRHSVLFLGVRSDVPALLAVADLYVHPSLQEGYSNALLEAMAAGKAVVATAVGGNVEAVSDGVNGLLVPPQDSIALEAAMSRLLADLPAARRMGELARRAVHETYEIGAMVKTYERVYTSLVERKAQRLGHRERARAGPTPAPARRD